MKNIPHKIYLQIGDKEDLCGVQDFKDLHCGSVTWCEDKINDNDIEYNKNCGWRDAKKKLPNKNIESVLVVKNGNVTTLVVDYYFYKNDYRNFDIIYWMLFLELFNFEEEYL
jgi:hypothetical protein